MWNKIEKIKRWLRGGVDFHLMSKIRTLPPRGMIINLTYRCNSRCVMCNIWQSDRKNEEMRYSDWRKWVDDPIFLKVEDLTVSGGEPVMHPEVIKIIRLLVDKLPKLQNLSLISNGFAVERVVDCVEKVAKITQDKKVHFGVSISLDGIGKKHDEIRQTNGGFEKTKETIEKLKFLRGRYGFNLNIGSLILRQNLGDFKKTKRWLEGEGLAYGFQIVGFHETFVNNLDSQNKVDFRKKDKQKLKEILKKLRSSGGFKSYYWNDLAKMYFRCGKRTTPCPFWIDEMAIDGLGNVFYCLSEPAVGNFLKENRSIADIYFDKKNLMIRNKRRRMICLRCNSGCDVELGIKNQLFNWLRFKLLGD